MIARFRNDNEGEIDFGTQRKRDVWFNNEEETIKHLLKCSGEEQSM